MLNLAHTKARIFYHCSHGKCECFKYNIFHSSRQTVLNTEYAVFSPSTQLPEWPDKNQVARFRCGQLKNYIASFTLFFTDQCGVITTHFSTPNPASLDKVYTYLYIYISIYRYTSCHPTHPIITIQVF